MGLTVPELHLFKLYFEELCETCSPIIDKVPWIISFKFMYGAAFSIIFIIIISDK